MNLYYYIINTKNEVYGIKLRMQNLRQIKWNFIK